MFLDNNVEANISSQLSSEEFIHQPYWKVRLSTGEYVYSRHDRRSWLELKQWLSDNKSVFITGLWLGFRDNLIEIHTGKADYFMVNVHAEWYGGGTIKYIIAGYRDGDVVRTKKYRIPEIYFEEEDIRQLDDPSVIVGLIQNVENDLSE